MATLFVLDVEEFRPLVTAARHHAEISIDGPKKGYFRLSTDGDLRMSRLETGMIEAVWFGAFTAGFKGSSLEVDAAAFTITS
jgi:hypothetical protein